MPSGLRAARFFLGGEDGLGGVCPQQVVLVELELWPNLIRETFRRGIALALINGRISERSHRGYRRIRPLISRLLAKCDLLAVQSSTYRERLMDLGAPPQRIEVTGSVKFDGTPEAVNDVAADQLRRSFGLGPEHHVLVAGSTHGPEERHVLDTYRELKAEFPKLRLLLVPRHQERFDEVARLVQSCGFPLLRRTSTESCSSGDGASANTVSSGLEPPVLLLDTLGELSQCWRLASIAFVGGSLMKRGGQNMIEPAGCGAAVLVGPHTHNFHDVVTGLKSQGGVRVVANAQELTRTVRDCLEHPEVARQQGDAARQFVRAQRGAAVRTVQLLLDLDCREEAEAVRRAA